MAHQFLMIEHLLDPMIGDTAASGGNSPPDPRLAGSDIRRVMPGIRVVAEFLPITCLNFHRSLSCDGRTVMMPLDSGNIIGMLDPHAVAARA